MKKLLILILAGLITRGAIAQTYKGETQNKSITEKLNDEYCSGLFKTTDGTVLDMSASNVSAYRNILEWLDNRVAGLQVYRSRTGQSVPMIRGSVPGLFVDENPVSLSFVNSMNVNDIAMVKIIKSPFFGGFNTGNGAIAIYTYAEEGEDPGNNSN